MREVNFSIPNANKASVGITAALYDRRALDCTSTLPLINSLNHLAYLTTSSARIRDILTVDGGIERLVVILKEGRSKDLMSMWKWNLAFQCVVNIGVRGSETVRTRVVEADMVPVIATILNNYIQVVDKARAKAEAAAAAKRNSATARSRENRTAFDRTFVTAERGIRRSLAPHSIAIPPAVSVANAQVARAHAEFIGHPSASGDVNAGADRVRFPSFGRLQDRRQFQQYTGNTGAPATRLDSSMQPLAAALPAVDPAMSGLNGLQNARDIVPSMMGNAGGPSQPASPTTPNPPINGQPYNSRIAPRNGRLAIRHQRSMSGESEGADSEELPNPRATMATGSEPLVDIQTGVDIEGDALLESVDTPMALGGAAETQDPETFNITHRSPLDGSILNPINNAQPLGFSPNAPANPPLGLPASLLPSRFMAESGNSVAYPAMPREEDVLMSLQLLAYVSKYCDLREYFQKSHLVPSLSISKELDPESADPEEVEEYLLPDNFNIFPLVEKFTVRHHSQEMQYWAGVVMRNLCRKDDARGGIRQCAHYECGKWEEFTRQFAKCRRCRRTKYCSKECQKKAWVYHRHWCVAAQP